MAPITHLVVTRFGIGIRDEAWYRRRFAIFSTICFPSLAGQTRTDFTWLVVCDSRAPAWLDDAFATLRKTMPRLELRRHDPIRRGTLAPMSHGTAREHVPEGGLLLSSRIDDDDCWSFDYVEKLRAIIDAARPALGNRIGVTFTNGLEYDTTDDTVRPIFYPWHSMAVNILSPLDPYASCYKFSHARSREKLTPLGWSMIDHPSDQPFWIYARYPDAQAIAKGLLSDAVAEPMAGEATARVRARFGVTLPAPELAPQPVVPLDPVILENPAVEAILASGRKGKLIMRIDIKNGLLAEIKAAAKGSTAHRALINLFYAI